MKFLKAALQIRLLAVDVCAILPSLVWLDLFWSVLAWSGPIFALPPLVLHIQRPREIL
jgi:hypothetical protein